MDWDKLAIAGVISKYKDLFDYVRPLIDSPELELTWDWKWQELADKAAYEGKKDLLIYILPSAKFGPFFQEWNWQDLAESAVAGGYKDLFDYIRSLAPKDYN